MLSDTQTLVLLIALIVAAVAVIVWAVKTRHKDAPETNPFVRTPRRQRARQAETRRVEDGAS